jgi:CRP/FNR family transcriptional regulator
METQEFLKTIPLFSGIEEKYLKKISEIVKEKKYPKGSVVFFEDEPGETIYIIKDGKIKIYIISEQDGREKILTILQSGDFFGEMAILDGAGRSATAQCLEDSILLIIYKNNFIKLLKESSEISHRIIYNLVHRLRETNMQVKELVFMNVRQRTIKTLLRLSEDYKKVKNGKSMIFLTHDELARFVGTSRETISRILSDFEKEKILETKRQSIIVDVKKLKELEY